MERSLAQLRWNTLIRRIKRGTCLPFIGAGASATHFKTAPEIAEMLAKENHYPFADFNDLARVTQYMAIQNKERNIVKETLVESYFPPTEVQFDDPHDPYGLLADLQLPLYITTNYDDLMVQALRSRNRDPQVAVCRWNASATLYPNDDVFKTRKGYEPTPQEPIVYFLHGYREQPHSLVLTEDDYLDFLVKLGRQKDLIPPIIQQAMAKQTLLFIGYGIRDYTFRVLFNTIAAAVDRSDQVTHVSVQLLPSLAAEAPEEAQSEVEEYLNAYFESQNIFMYWGDARDFCKDFRLRFEESEATGG